MSDQALRRAWRRALEPVMQPDTIRRVGQMSAAFDTGGGVRPDALESALPGLPLTWWLPGTVTVGTNVGAEYELPSRVRIRDIRVRCKTAPVGNELTVRLTGNGAEIESASVGIGANDGRTTGINRDVDAGTVLRLDIPSAAGADVTVLVSYGAATS